MLFYNKQILISNNVGLLDDPQFFEPILILIELLFKKDFPFCEVLDNTKDNTIFLHMRAGTNWINYNIKTRNEILLKFLDNL